MARPENALVAVFGSSEPRPGEPAYALARRVGELLARAGYGVITGAYGGVMEAASRGAREAGGRTVGVPCAIFAGRSPNAFLDETIASRDLYDRSRELIERARAYVVLPGRAGTLSELTLLWALNRAGCLDRRPVVLLGDAWGPLLDLLDRSRMLEDGQKRVTSVAASPEEAVLRIARHLRAPGPD
jgi:uncharacterized protein (TIGR00730 family)